MEQIAMSVAEAAEALSLGQTLTRELIANGDLPAVRVSRRVLVPVQGLRDFVAGLATDQVAPPTNSGAIGVAQRHVED